MDRGRAACGTATRTRIDGNVVRLVLAILAVCVLVFGLLVMAIFGGYNFGTRLFGLIGLSAIPLIGIIAYVLWLDRWRPQPKLILGLCLLWGAVASVGLTLFVSFISEVALSLVGVGGVPDVFATVVQAPIVEETVKTSLLVVIVLLARRHFDGPLDGLVYGASSARASRSRRTSSTSAPRGRRAPRGSG